MNPNDELIYNWTNSLRHTKDGVILAATRIASELKESGYEAKEAMDILIADDYEDRVAEAAIKQIFADPEESVKESTREQPVVAYVVPTRYEDVKPYIEKQLRECSAVEFVNKLARSEYPILMNLPDNKVESFVRSASAAKHNPYLAEILHKDLLPFFEHSMYESVRLSEEKRNRITIAATSNSKYSVAESLDNVNDVCLKSGTCNCDKYTKGHYADFGLACEHIVAATNEVSPNSKLVKGEMDD